MTPQEVTQLVEQGGAKYREPLKRLLDSTEACHWRWIAALKYVQRMYRTSAVHFLIENVVLGPIRIITFLKR
jgi:hypothetical protein